MEAFLTTLPPYVHDFLNKHPPTDVFNLLRELICFAVLYSEDRDRIISKTNELLQKKEDAEKDGIVPEMSTGIETISEEKEEDEEEEETISTEQQSNLLKVGEQPTQKLHSSDASQDSKIINTFPQWWGHQESQSLVEVKHNIFQKEEVTSPVQENSSLWVSLEIPAIQKHKTRANSQIIPDLRSYLEPSSVKNTPSKRNSVATTKPDIKDRKVVTGDIKAVRRISSPVTHSQATKALLNEKSNAKTQTQQTQQTPKSNSSGKTNGISRSASSSVTQPRQNAALRARAEHARQQQEELERKKQLASKPLGSSASLRLKQRVNSGIDWDKIKAERRKTISETTKKE